MCSSGYRKSCGSYTPDFLNILSDRTDIMSHVLLDKLGKEVIYFGHASAVSGVDIMVYILKTNFHTILHD